MTNKTITKVIECEIKKITQSANHCTNIIYLEASVSKIQHLSKATRSYEDSLPSFLAQP